MKKTDKILVLGSRGLVGSALKRELVKDSFENVLTPVREELDLFDQRAVLDYFKIHSPSHVFLSAAKVGGIHANNTFRADFIHQNILIQSNVIDACFKTN
ncbi:MAG: NAD-dependent epimerase/dehydratase family protein, partial [Bacteriovoracaceae bacterium]|nr:NAD-dependent epimerase/dehydratase family protein [Bacteriovoracaceae bacterium]